MDSEVYWKLGKLLVLKGCDQQHGVYTDTGDTPGIDTQCDWYSLLLTLGNMVSITKSIYRENGHSLWLSWSCIRNLSTLYQAQKALCTRFLLHLPINLNVPGCQTDYSPSYWPWSSQVPGQPGCDGTITEQWNITEHRPLSTKLSSYKT